MPFEGLRSGLRGPRAGKIGISRPWMLTVLVTQDSLAIRVDARFVHLL